MGRASDGSKFSLVSLIIGLAQFINRNNTRFINKLKIFQSPHIATSLMLWKYRYYSNRHTTFEQTPYF